MEHWHQDHCTALANPGVVSLQLLSPRNAGSPRIAITRVTVAPGAMQPRHRHPGSEQVWIALHGSGTLLLAEGDSRPLQAGELVRFADGEVHGLENTGAQDFVYLAITAPPIDFRSAYETSAEPGSAEARP